MLTIRYFTELGTYKGWEKFAIDRKFDCVRWVNSGNSVKIAHNEYKKEDIKELKELFKHEILVIKTYKESLL